MHAGSATAPPRATDPRRHGRLLPPGLETTADCRRGGRDTGSGPGKPVMMSSSEPPPDQGRVFPLLREAFGQRSLTARRAAGVISIATVILTVAGGVAIWLVDRDSFSSLGEGLWWSVQTLTTVGYGDVVPDDTTGRLIGTLVMLNGIAFLTVITAAVTATLIDQMRQASSSVIRARRRRSRTGRAVSGRSTPGSRPSRPSWRNGIATRDRRTQPAGAGSSSPASG